LKQNKLCALSGLPIKFARANKRTSETSASLDRIDSTKNYVEGNVQWVHKEVNIMKNVYNQEHFIEMCKLIANNN
jgi:archaellum component FlaC